jgi:hypothetical protein
MSREKTQILYDTIKKYFQKYNFDRKRTTNHFLEQGINKRLIQRVLKRFEDEGNVNLKPIPGRPRTLVRN